MSVGTLPAIFRLLFVGSDFFMFFFSYIKVRATIWVVITERGRGNTVRQTQNPILNPSGKQSGLVIQPNYGALSDIRVKGRIELQ